MEKLSTEEKLDLILKNQAILDDKLLRILLALEENDARANTSMFIQGFLLGDFIKNMGV